MRLFRYLGLTLAVMAPLLILATLGSIFISFGRNDAIVIALLIGFTSVFGYAWYRHEHYRTCSEIRLSDDGTCELETKRRLIGLHVNEIRSVQLSPESDDRDESYSVRYQGGKLAVFGNGCAPLRVPTDCHHHARRDRVGDAALKPEFENDDR